ncbi:MAG: hypothetical protein QM744_09535 [Mesorhizobium sp.]
MLSCVPTLAWADEPAAARAKRLVEQGLVEPLANREPKRFSRVRMPPRERRVRITQPAASVDGKSRAFLPFAIDVRYGSQWRDTDLFGCVYLSTGSIFVKRGDAYRPVAFLLGKHVEPVAGVCEAAAARS